jgi:hypothetical protein
VTSRGKQTSAKSGGFNRPKGTDQTDQLKAARSLDQGETTQTGGQQEPAKPVGVGETRGVEPPPHGFNEILPRGVCSKKVY